MPLVTPPPGPDLVTGAPPGSLNDLLLATPGAGLWDLGTRDLPRKVVLDRDLSASGGTAGLAKFSSVCSFFFEALLPIENLVIFLRVFFNMLAVFSWGEVLPDLSAVLALELAVPEL